MRRNAKASPMPQAITDYDRIFITRDNREDKDFLDKDKKNNKNLKSKIAAIITTTTIYIQSSQIFNFIALKN